MNLKDLIETTWKGWYAIEQRAASICYQPTWTDEITRDYMSSGGRLIKVGADRFGRWNVDLRITPYPEVLPALEHAFGQPARECTMDGERCLHWDLGDIEVVATSSYLQLTLQQPIINCEPNPKGMVS